jgi:GTP:adenosylcobinamide-phosphate guanylyltransferase
MIALVLAGGKPDDVARTQPGAANKAFVNVGGVTLVERTLQPLRRSRAIDRIIVVAPEAVHGDPALTLADECRPDGEKIRTSLRNGLENLPPDDLVLVSASDLPVLTTEAVDDFIARAMSLDPDLGYGCVEKSVHVSRFPTVPHTWARMRDGTYCGAGLVVIKPRAYPKLDRVIERLGHARKNPLRLASLFGLPILAKFAVGRLRIAEAESKASEILGSKVRAIKSAYPEIAVNVDRFSDIALADDLITSGSILGGENAESF